MADCVSAMTLCATSTPAAPHYAALGQHFARWLGFLGEGRLPNREALAPLARGTEVDMDEARARVRSF